jgi:hypothetical protein
MAVAQSDTWNSLRQSYGGSDSTLPSFLRPYYVKYNAVSKSRDLGSGEILIADLSGDLGAEGGANTLFFKVTLPRELELRVIKRGTGSWTDKYIRVGVLDSERRQVQLSDDGYAFQNDIHNTDTDESLARMPGGVYYITVSSNQWQRLEYAISVFVGRYALLSGAASGAFSPSGRFPLAKIAGAARGDGLPEGTLLNPNKIKRLANSAVMGTAVPTLSLAILRGAAVGRLFLDGRLKMTWKVTGAAGGSDATTGTLSSEAPYGGGYGY